MLQYLIILLDETSSSYCHYDNSRIVRKLIPLDLLLSGIRFSMMENLMVQFVYPEYELPQEYKKAIESIDHSKIVPSLCTDKELVNNADIIVYDDWTGMNYSMQLEGKSVVLRTTKSDLFDRFMFLKNVLSKVARLNIVIRDVNTFNSSDFDVYKRVLNSLAEYVEKLYLNGKRPQLNILTDRMMLKDMNNCGAGDTNITLAPNGKLYICPAFYLEELDSVGNLTDGLHVKNKQLYRLDHAPICRHCDAWQCRRCVWLNTKMTLEVNTPSHEQCVLAHLERNVSSILLKKIRKHIIFLPEQEEFGETDYLDPFDNRNQWQ